MGQQSSVRFNFPYPSDAPCQAYRPGVAVPKDPYEDAASSSH